MEMEGGVTNNIMVFTNGLNALADIFFHETDLAVLVGEILLVPAGFMFLAELAEGEEPGVDYAEAACGAGFSFFLCFPVIDFTARGRKREYRSGGGGGGGTDRSPKQQQPPHSSYAHTRPPASPSNARPRT